MEHANERYLFFDLDGTVLIDGKIEDAARNAMLQAQKQGHRLILCTGRTRAGVRGSALIASIPWDGMILGGADIFYGGECCAEAYLTPRQVHAWMRYARERQIYIILEGQNRIHRFPFHEQAEQNALPTAAQLQREVRALLRADRITKLSLIGNGLELWDPPKNGMELVVHRSYAEAFATGCGKGSAIQKFCRLLNVSPTQCVCFGDSRNDLSMFSVCPVGICMPQSAEELLAVATYRIREGCGVEDGIAWLFSGESALAEGEAQ